MTKSTKKELLLAALKSILAGIPAPAFIKISANFLAELTDRFEELPFEQKKVLAEISSDEFSELLEQTELATINAAAAEVGVKQVKKAIMAFQEKLTGRFDIFEKNIKKTIEAGFERVSEEISQALSIENIRPEEASNLVKNITMKTGGKISELIEKVFVLTGIQREFAFAYARLKGQPFETDANEVRIRLSEAHIIHSFRILAEELNQENWKDAQPLANNINLLTSKLIERYNLYAGNWNGMAVQNCYELSMELEHTLACLIKQLTLI